MEAKARYKSVDVAKGVLILLVIISHIPNLVYHSPQLIRWIHSFFMPSFFVLSGLFFQPMNTISLLKKRFYTLLIPYGVFTLWGWLEWIGRTIIKHDTDYRELYMFIVGGNNYNGVLWFLLALFFVNVIANEIVKIPNKYIQLILLFLISLFAYSFQDLSLLGKYNIGSALLCVPFFLISYYIRDFYLSCFGRQRKFFFISLLLIAILYFFNQKMNNLAAGIIKWPYALFYIYVFFATFVVMYISDIIQEKKIGKLIAYFGERSLGVMCVHLAFISGQYFIMNITPYYWFNISVLLVIVLVESVVVTNLILKYLPLALGRKK